MRELPVPEPVPGVDRLALTTADAREGSEASIHVGTCSHSCWLCFDAADEG